MRPGEPMRHGIMRRFAATAATATALPLTLAGAGCGDFGRTRAATDTASGVIDSAPAAVGQAVAAILTNENVFALLDTAFALMMRTDMLAQQRAASEDVRLFARNAVSTHSLARQGASAQAERLRIAPVLPRQEIIEHYREGLPELQSRTGRAFDAAYLDWTIEAHEELIDRVERSLRGATEEPIHTFLSQVRTNLQAELQQARAIRERLAS